MSVRNEHADPEHANVELLGCVELTQPVFASNGGNAVPHERRVTAILPLVGLSIQPLALAIEPSHGQQDATITYGATLRSKH